MAHRLIGLTGLARSGKDTVADHLVRHHGYTRVAFADPLRQAALALDPIIEPTAAGGTGPIRLSAVVGGTGWHAAKDVPEVRRTLQRLGSEAGWMIHGEDLWLRRAQETIAAVGGPVVVTDVRMPHEAAWMTEQGAALWRVTRPGSGLHGEQAVHGSEAGGFDVDQELCNDGTLDNLYTAAGALLRL